MKVRVDERDLLPQQGAFALRAGGPVNPACAECASFTIVQLVDTPKPLRALNFHTLATSENSSRALVHGQVQKYYAPCNTIPFVVFPRKPCDV